MVLPPQRRARPPPLHRPGAPGETRLLVPRGVPVPAPGAVGVTPGSAEESGGPRAERGSRPRPPPPSADRPLDGEAASHLRDDRGGGPRRVGEVADAAEPFAAGLRGYPGAARHRPQLRALQRKRPVGPRDAAHRPFGEWSSRFRFNFCQFFRVADTF
jgi:hypothetical protein